MDMFAGLVNDQQIHLLFLFQFITGDLLLLFINALLLNKMHAVIFNASNVQTIFTS